MTHYRDIYEIAADNYGIVTSAQAKEVGVSDKEMSAIASRGRIDRIGHGVYRLRDYIPTKNDSYAEAVALVGPTAYLYGESVLAMHELAPTNPAFVYVATPKRVRKSLPEYLTIVKEPGREGVTSYEGIPSQPIAEAIRSCKGSIMPERLIDAVEKASDQGYLTRQEKRELLKELRACG